MKKALCLLLSTLFLLILISGCASGTADPEKTEPMATTAAPAESATEPPVTDYALDDIPDSLKFDGEEITLFYWSDREHEEFVAEAQNGEAVNDAIFARNAKVSERLGITLAFESTKGNASNIANFTSAVQNMVKSGDHQYDMIGVYSITAGNLAVNGLLYDLRTCAYLNWDKPWWPDSLIQDATINDRLYFASGDISANTIYMMYVTFFNKQFIDDFKLENPYQLVDSGAWTIDKMLEMCTGIYSDLNLSNAPDIGDLYGQYAYTLHLDAFLAGAGIRCIDASGETLTISEDFTGEKALDIAAKITTFFHQNDRAYLLTKNESVHMHFAENTSLFWNDRCRNAAAFKNNETSFGVVPCPKYSTDQADYYTLLGNPFSAYGLPADCRDPEMMAAVMECYASESYRTVSPAIYDITMKYRYTDDETSGRMFDIVRSGVIFDLGRIFSSNLGGPYSTFESCIANSNSWMTVVNGSKKLWNNGIKTILKSFN